MRYRGRHSSAGLKIGKFIFSQIISSSKKSRWRIGNNIDVCTLCGRCQAVCPVNAITVSVHDKTWTLNNIRCIKCLNCVVKCPVHCLSQVSL